jgi:hypothetical protein
MIRDKTKRTNAFEIRYLRQYSARKTMHKTMLLLKEAIASTGLICLDDVPRREENSKRRNNVNSGKWRTNTRYDTVDGIRVQESTWIDVDNLDKTKVALSTGGQHFRQRNDGHTLVEG